jgi:prepilin-type N-terminal cleavage/methylation domain-containing protein
MDKSFVIRTDRRTRAEKGFTLIELLVGSAVMLIAILAALELYSRSNKVAVDQQQYAEIQHDVRTSMYLISRDIRMAGVGLPQEFAMYSFEGIDNENLGAGVYAPDRLSMMGNIEDPLDLRIDSYHGASSEDPLELEDYSFEQFPYLDAYYADKFVLVLPNPATACRAAEVRVVDHVTHTGGTTEELIFSSGLASGVNPPGGLSGTCADSNNYSGGLATFIDVLEYWLDLTGNATGPGLTAANGYIGGGVGGVLYMTRNGIHSALAQNIENLQFEYNGDLNADGTMDGFVPWNNAWTVADVNNIRQIRIWVLGRTPNRVLNVSGRPTGGIHIYRRPAVSDTPADTVDDRCKRFLMNSTANVRNLSLNIYNLGVR